ncbi:hypothetical protein Ciccas_004002 [Cichlidogyrus casuarinus]|uniref:DNRLRE domain-containing protein n=1 Tax=Cichlidogyrus casuarinus TaxID=1844966 RepID=A0ABD2QCS1_9PLAT
MASLPGTYFLLAQVKTGDGTLFRTLQFPINIKSAPIELRYTSPISKNSIFNAFEYLPGQSINFRASVYDVLSGSIAENLDVMPVNWNVMATICDAKYGANATLNSVNAWIRNSGSSIGSTQINLDAIKKPGFYQICLSSKAFSVENLANDLSSSYGLNPPSVSTLDILVRPENYTSPGSGQTSKIMLKFPGDFNSITASLFAQDLMRLANKKKITKIACILNWYLCRNQLPALAKQKVL